MEFKDNLYRIRKEKGMSQEELAALCDVSRQAKMVLPIQIWRI